jgi:hypothetical protein
MIGKSIWYTAHPITLARISVNKKYNNSYSYIRRYKPKAIAFFRISGFEAFLTNSLQFPIT